MHAFDGRTDRQSDRILIVRPRLHSMQRGKNRLRLAKVIVKNKMSRFLWFSVYMYFEFQMCIGIPYRTVSRFKNQTSIYWNYKSDSQTARCHSDSKHENLISSSCYLEVRQSDLSLFTKTIGTKVEPQHIASLYPKVWSLFYVDFECEIMLLNFLLKHFWYFYDSAWKLFIVCMHVRLFIISCYYQPGYIPFKYSSYQLFFMRQIQSY